MKNSTIEQWAALVWQDDGEKLWISSGKSSMRGYNTSLTAFVTFRTRESAERAIHRHLGRNGGGGAVVPVSCTATLEGAERVTWVAGGLP